jgi:hypothetical protein
MTRRLRDALFDKTNTAIGVWADTACRSASNDECLEWLRQVGPPQEAEGPCHA